MQEDVLPLSGRITFGEAADFFIRDREDRGIKHSTLRSYRSMLNARLLPVFGEMPITRITWQDIDRFRTESDGKPKAIANRVTLMGAIMEYAIRQRWIRHNPCKQVEPVKVPKSTEIHFLLPDEVERLLESLPTDAYGLRRRVLYLCAVQSGLRQGELLALRWKDVDFEARKLRVIRNYTGPDGGMTTPKSGSMRSVPMSARLGEELRAHRQRSAFPVDDGLVFGHPQTGDPMNGKTAMTQFTADLGRADVRRIVFHDLRHTFGTTMASAGVPLRTLQAWMGHADASTTQIYAHYAPDSREADMVDAAFTRPSILPST
jgi:integrase